jgi:cell division protein FtsA
MNELAVGVDIGSSKICTILGEIDRNNQLQILGVGTSECKGLKKGVIIDIDNTAESIKSSVEQAERMSGMEIKSAFINLPGGQAMLIKNKGVIAVLSEDREITNSDVERALQAASIVSMPIDRG